MGEAAGKKHFLLRRTGDDGPAEGSLLPDPVPHRGDLRSLLRFRVSPLSSFLFLLIMICSRKRPKGHRRALSLNVPVDAGRSATMSQSSLFPAFLM